MLGAVAASQKHEPKSILAANAVYLTRVLFQHFSESFTAVQLAAFSTDTAYDAADIEPSKGLCPSLSIVNLLKIHFDLALAVYQLTTFMLKHFVVRL